MIHPAANPNQTVPTIASGISLGAGLLSFSNIMSVLQLLAIIVSVLSGAASLAWYVYNLKREMSKTAAVSRTASDIVLAAATTAAEAENGDVNVASKVVAAAATAGKLHTDPVPQ